MAYTNNQNLYYNFFINGKEADFNPSFLTNLKISDSIFELYPSISFSLINKENALYQSGFGNPKNTLSMDIGISEDDSNMETYSDFVLESMDLGEARQNLTGEMLLKFVPKVKQYYASATPAMGWSTSSTSSVISNIIKKDFKSYNIESTKSIGYWNKPNNQSIQSFLKILKNRSVSSIASPSKMFMWIDKYGKFNFKSLEKMISSNYVEKLDFTDVTTDFLTPTEFDYSDNGLRYKTEDINKNFNEYIYDIDGEGALRKLIPIKQSSLDGFKSKNIESINTFTQSQTIVQGYYHSLLPKEYNQGIYINNCFNFPLRFSFKIQNVPNIKSGDTVFLAFKHNDDKEQYDMTLTGKYLVTSIVKREVSSLFIMEIYVVSNSYLETPPILV